SHGIWKDARNRFAFGNIGHQPNGLALTASTWQFGSVQREYLAAARKHQNFGNGFGKKRHGKSVVALELQGRKIRDLAFERGDPTLFRDDDGQRLALDQGFRNIGAPDIW